MDREDLDLKQTILIINFSTNDEQVYNEFVSKRIKNSDSKNDFHFKIVEVKSKTNKNVSLDATNKLQELNKNNDTKTSRSSDAFKGGATKRLSGLSGFSADDSRFSNVHTAGYFQSATENDGIVRKRVKPGYLLK